MRRPPSGLPVASPDRGLGSVHGKGMQVLRREIRAQVGAMAPDCAVFHQRVLYTCCP